jgi:hypothetical protein
MLKWIGYVHGAEWLPGIPARDLSDDEVEQYGGEAGLLATGLYEPVTGKLKTSVKKSVEEKRLPSDLEWSELSEPDEADFNTI